MSDSDGDHEHYPFSNFHDNQNDLNRKIFLVALVSLSIVVAFVIALHLYARFVLRRRARRRAAIHRLSLTVAHAHANTIEPPNTGLDPHLIAALPIFVFKPKEEAARDNGGSSVTECAVCLSALEDQEMVRLLPNCNHTFHVACIDTWLGSHSTCPICRTKAEPRLEPRPREGPTGLALDSAPTAPPLDLEGASDGDIGGASAKVNGSNSRLSSFRRILSWERSSRRIQPSTSHGVDDNMDQDL